MQDRELYRKILGIESPWDVTEVKLDVKNQQVDIWVEHDPKVLWPCPECGRKGSCRDHAEERIWRHLDTCQFRTLLHARIPRLECPEHGVRQAKVPWAEARSRFTLLMEQLIIDVLQECATIIGAARILNISWDEAWGVMERAVRRGRARKEPTMITHYGVDEKAFRKGHSYMTVVCDLDGATVEHVSEHRTKESLSEYWKELTLKQLQAIKAIAMDMWQPYIGATIAVVPDASEKIVFDRFHIMRDATKAVDTVRKIEHRKLRKEGDETLAGTKYLWLFSEENIPEYRLPTFESLIGMDLKVGKAWALKESLRHLWDYFTPSWAEKYFHKWYQRVTRSKLPPMIQMAKRLKSHLHNILTYCRHRVTNAVAEGLNSKIMAVKRRACGYRNNEHFKISIYFYCGGLDLYPR